jgi:hypothetical protein
MLNSSNGSAALIELSCDSARGIHHWQNVMVGGWRANRVPQQ